MNDYERDFRAGRLGLTTDNPSQGWIDGNKRRLMAEMRRAEQQGLPEGMRESEPMTTGYGIDTSPAQFGISTRPGGWRTDVPVARSSGIGTATKLGAVALAVLYGGYAYGVRHLPLEALAIQVAIAAAIGAAIGAGLHVAAKLLGFLFGVLLRIVVVVVLLAIALHLLGIVDVWAMLNRAMHALGLS